MEIDNRLMLGVLKTLDDPALRPIAEMFLDGAVGIARTGDEAAARNLIAAAAYMLERGMPLPGRLLPLAVDALQAAAAGKKNVAGVVAGRKRGPSKATNSSRNLAIFEAYRQLRDKPNSYEEAVAALADSWNLSEDGIREVIDPFIFRERQREETIRQLDRMLAATGAAPPSGEVSP